jgi:uncharacterized lipoprotein YajG
MPARLLAAASLLLFAACTDDRSRQVDLSTAPPQPALTMKTLPKGASTICVASVRQRDAALAKPAKARASLDLTSLDALIEDVCH